MRAAPLRGFPFVSMLKTSPVTPTRFLVSQGFGFASAGLPVKAPSCPSPPASSREPGPDVWRVEAVSDVPVAPDAREVEEQDVPQAVRDVPQAQDELPAVAPGAPGFVVQGALRGRGAELAAEQA
jgi:hypothetical protein